MHTPWAVPLVSDTDEIGSNLREAVSLLLWVYLGSCNSTVV